MKNAEEMFKEIGYDKYEDTKIIAYTRDVDNLIDVGEIDFWLCTKRITADYIDADPKILQAINQQCKELGWLE